ncbi:hypothetical protein VVD49_19020 [Uliginosibacterium sp. H3]|uniref:Membrane protein involved in the export of O-antigen and teichoic acid n=1 Tax=Uliginosibacterium silvisoli TaxID=3114758 RepID=A0ABU6K8I3_9RHOO|nr:hypothetical protein [Uliginosibacterium sp. H3]
MRLERLRGAANGLAGRFVSNAMRQVIGAGLFFATTLLLTRGLGSAGYAEYFLNWNLAQILVPVVSFGLYNDVVRRLATGEAAPQVIRKMLAPHALQLALLSLAAFVIAQLSHYDSWLVLMIAATATFGTLLTAVSLGRDAFRTFALGELLHNIVLLVLVAIVVPHSARVVGYLYVGAAFAKLLLYLYCLPREVSLGGQASTIADGDSSAARATGRSYALRAYGHSLLQILSFRGFVLASGYLLPPGGMASLAIIWSFCDRALTLVQGVNQILYPRLIAGTVSQRMRTWMNVITSAGYVLAVLGMLILWVILARFGLAAPLRADYSAYALCIAFVPHVLRLLKMTEALAESRFTALFSSHALTMLGFAIAGISMLAMHTDSPWQPAVLIFVASSLGLPAFYLMDRRPSIDGKRT